MLTFSSLLSCFALFMAVVSLVITARNAWVVDRMGELNRFENGVHLVTQYEDYGTMMRRFWVLDIEKFKKA